MATVRVSLSPVSCLTTSFYKTAVQCDYWKNGRRCTLSCHENVIEMAITDALHRIFWGIFAQNRFRFLQTSSTHNFYTSTPFFLLFIHLKSGTNSEQKLFETWKVFPMSTTVIHHENWQWTMDALPNWIKKNHLNIRKSENVCYNTEITDSSSIDCINNDEFQSRVFIETI